MRFSCEIFPNIWIEDKIQVNKVLVFLTYRKGANQDKLFIINIGKIKLNEKQANI